MSQITAYIMMGISAIMWLVGPRTDSLVLEIHLLICQLWIIGALIIQSIRR